MPEDTAAPVIFSAHGVPRSVPEEAAQRKLFALDATCPLVTKVHREAEIHHRRGREILLIGHAGHPEVIGTMGQLPPGAVNLIETLADTVRTDPGEGGGRLLPTGRPGDVRRITEADIAALHAYRARYGVD